MTRTNFLLTAALLMFYGCTVKKANGINQMKWVIGTWEHITPKGSIYETWKKDHKNNELMGKSYKLKNKDTIVFETIRLVQDQGGLFYIPVVKDQNDGIPVRFQAKVISAKQVVFENKTHDFPQVISYAKINKDSLQAEISGLRNGKQERRYFPMKRIK